MEKVLRNPERMPTLFQFSGRPVMGNEHIQTRICRTMWRMQRLEHIPGVQRRKFHLSTKGSQGGLPEEPANPVRTGIGQELSLELGVHEGIMH